MDLPAGRIVKRVDLAHASLQSVFKALQDKSFTGYSALCCHGKTGLEEGAVFFNSGKGVGAHYEYLRFEKEVDGEPAFARCVNASHAKNVVLDLVQLTADQVQGVLSDEPAVLFVSTPESIQKYDKKTFSDEFEEELGQIARKKRSELLKKYRLNVSAGIPEKKESEQKKEEKPESQKKEDGRISAPPLGEGE
jgi:hypothetical protein